MIQLDYGYTIFFTAEIAGVATAADSTPTATLYRNGSASGVTVTVSATAVTGLYVATFTTDSGWEKTDVLHLVASAAIASTSGYVGVVWDSTGDVDAVMRGTDNAPAVSAIADELESREMTLTSAYDAAKTAAQPDDVSPTIDFSPTINPTELSTGDVNAIRSGLALSSELQPAAAAAVTAYGPPTRTEATEDKDEILAAVEAIDGGGGLSGDNAITVTIESSADDEPIENAKVRFYRSGQDETKATDVDGLTDAFGLDAATWNYVVSATGFTSKTGTLAVSADASVTYQLDPVAPSPVGTGNACRCTLGVVAIDETPITGAILSAATKDKNAFIGNSLVFPEQDKPTSVDGVITVYLIRGLEYDVAVRYNRKEVKFSFTCPDSSSANMGEIVV